jgi:hypothetical protein
MLLAGAVIVLATCTGVYPGAGSALAAGPTVKILAPQDGETITLPAPVRFGVTGIRVAPGEGQIKAFMPGIEDSPVVTLEPGNEVGVATFPYNKMFSGKRDITFALAGADGRLLDNAEARYTIKGLMIRGGR